MKINYKTIVDFNLVIKYKVFLAGQFLTKDLKNFIVGVSGKKGNFIFNFSKQIIALKNVFLLLNFIANKKPILFFGLNKKKYNPIHDSQISLINKEIFDLTFSFSEDLDINLKKNIDNFYENFYENNFFNKRGINILSVSKNFFDFDLLLKQSLKEDKLKINGFFFDVWEDAYLSNFHTLKSHLNFQLKKFFIERKKNNYLLGQDRDFLISFTGQFRNFFFLSKFLSKKEDFPGAAVFFSKKGYENLFLDLQKLGIPVICIIDSSETLEGVDYPLFGDTSFFDIIIFYQKIFKELLKK
jgi:hypothetical protein